MHDDGLVPVIKQIIESLDQGNQTKINLHITCIDQLITGNSIKIKSKNYLSSNQFIICA